MVADQFLQRVKAEISFAVDKVAIQTAADPKRKTFPSTYHFWICDLGMVTPS